MKSEAEKLAARIRMCVEIVGNGNELSRRSGVPRRSLENYLSAEREPKATTVAAIARAANVSAHWLITGEGPVRLGQPPEVGAPQLDSELMGRVVDAIAREAKALGVSLPPVDLGRYAADKYAEIFSASSDAAERMTMVKLMAVQLRKELLAPILPSADAATRKDSA